MNKHAQERVTDLIQEAVTALETAARYCEEHDQGAAALEILYHRNKLAKSRVNFFLRTYAPPRPLTAALEASIEEGLI